MPVIDPTPPAWIPEDDGPCGLWPLDTACCPNFADDPCDWEPRQLLAVEIATDMLWRLTAGRFGVCAELIRPCRRACAGDEWWEPEWWYGAGIGSGLGRRWLRPFIFGGRWFNLPCSCGPDNCGCGPLEAIDLQGPVSDVLEVRVDGELLSPGAWRVQRIGPDTRLIRRDGGHWPRCQDMTRPETEPGTWSVKYTRGRKVPAAGIRAVSTLACEIYKQCQNDSSCRLPARVKQVQREGVTYTMFDPGEELDQGLTGLREVDAWIKTVNPHQLAEPPAVYSLDLPSPQEHRRGAWERQ